MIRYYPQNRRNGKMKPPIYPRKKTEEELMKLYNLWRTKSPEIDDFNEKEMNMYINERWDIKRIINYRLHGIYDKWITENSNYKEFTEKEFDQFFDEGMSIDEIIKARHPSELYVKKTKELFKLSSEYTIHIDSISNDDSLEYSSSDNEMEYYSVEDDVEESDE